MPACFSLTPIGGTEPANLADVDRLICANFGWKCDQQFYVEQWSDIIGFKLACGMSWPDIMMEVAEDENDNGKLWQIAEWLSRNYVARHWYSRY